MADKFKTRTRDIYKTQQNRGPVPYSLEELRRALAAVLAKRPLCPYCNKGLSADDVSLDHKQPVSHGGKNELSNIHFTCKACNKSKGDFSHEEYTYLLKALDQGAAKFSNPGFRKRVVDALRISNSFRQGAAWRSKRKAQEG